MRNQLLRNVLNAAGRLEPLQRPDDVNVRALDGSAPIDRLPPPRRNLTCAICGYIALAAKGMRKHYQQALDYSGEGAAEC